ncbi:MAG: putative glycoside hydrolase, partial [Bacteroidota bacterium]
QSLNAGLDMYMAPDSWKGLYKSTLKHVKAGTIPMERLDDAVRRILRVKIASGIFEKGAPSTRPNAGNASLLALPKHRSIARRAVRESLVLLKNKDGLLPLDASKTILVVGDGAQSISKACGGWTLSWQGTGHTNDEFPNGQSILAGIEAAAATAGGRVIHAPDGNSSVKADVVIAVYGEDPYAEFQGDRKDLDFKPNAFDVSKLTTWREKGIPVVSVFLSGRPMWTNPELNASDAFVAAWLPGSEGGGVSDLLFQRDPSFDFTGRLSFSWPATAVHSTTTAPLFDLGYGLSYGDESAVAELSETSGLNASEVASTGSFFAKGIAVAPWSLWLAADGLSKQIASFPTSVGGLLVSKTDHEAQEDALRLKWTTTSNDHLRISAVTPSDMSRQATAAMELAFSAKSFGADNASVRIGMCAQEADCDQALAVIITAGDWREYRLSLNCFSDLGVEMTQITSAVVLAATEGVDIGLSNIRLETDRDAKPGCDGN